MGTLRSTKDLTGYTYNDVILGDPVEVDGDPTTFEWDDSLFPTGVASLKNGAVVVVVDEAP